MTTKDKRPVLVLGGTGHYGRRIVAALHRDGVAVRVLSRNIAAARELLGADIEIVAGDVVNDAVIAESLAGTRSVVVSLSAMSPGAARQMRAIERDAVLRVFDLASSAGVRRLVYLSGYEIRTDFIAQFGLERSFGIKAEVEAVLPQTDLDWTIMGHAPSMEIYFAMLRGDTLNVPGGGTEALPVVAPDDAGTVVARAALRDDLGGQRFHVTGPEALSFPAAARRIGKVLGRPIRFRAIPLLPLRVGTAVAGVFNPFFQYIWASITLMNNFPPDLADGVPKAHRRLVDTFEFTPMTLEDETRQRMEAGTLR